MKIKTSLDWTKVQTDLLHQSNSLSPDHKKEAHRVIWNIAAMVTELSKLELRVRRSSNTNKTPRYIAMALDQINSEIDNIEQLMFLGVLSS